MTTRDVLDRLRALATAAEEAAGSRAKADDDPAWWHGVAHAHWSHVKDIDAEIARLDEQPLPEDPAQWPDARETPQGDAK